ncbi:hypothetical protein G6O69_30870 [Pseudenhygromyxa sp. WMMC2535]|uniref:hypothetical protein n=1 Tax=Pseudenhygromyxa sp. WMMC2535 TaxID=2712867 RepID=UPI0015548863|nr:hypothetical protein [Pseudenhygromyxa sp. WMMC2535]NVB42267.1 hypothetical protein [Pseudenhygromyxa sp. WMMC2535]
MFKLKVHHQIRRRVALTLAPRDACLAFVARYPGYFRDGENGTGAWARGLGLRERWFMTNLAQSLVWAWVEHEMQALAPLAEDFDALACAAIAVLRSKTRNQLEIDLDSEDSARRWLYATREDEGFEEEVFARLVRGASNCDGQNHLLQLLIEPWYRAALVGGNQGHKLLAVEVPGVFRPVFVDGWSNLPPFVLGAEGPFHTYAQLRERPESVVLGVQGRPLMSMDQYEEAGGTPITLSPRRDAPCRTWDFELEPPALDAASLDALADPWQIFLYARVLHLFDDPRAAALYERALNLGPCEFGGSSGRDAFVCEVSREMLVRREPWASEDDHPSPPPEIEDGSPQPQPQPAGDGQRPGKRELRGGMG